MPQELLFELGDVRITPHIATGGADPLRVSTGLDADAPATPRAQSGATPATTGTDRVR
jgi:hypothetical protein